MKRRVLNVVWGPFPDIRLEKTGRLLGEAGYQVDVLCMEAASTDWSHGEVIEAKLPGSIPERLIRRLITILRRNPIEFSWRYLGAFESVMATKKYDVVQWNDLPGVVEASEVAHHYGAKLVFDMHENYADNMWSTERDEGRPSYRYNVNAWLRYENAAVKVADRVLVNIDEMGERVIGMHGVSSDKLSIVRNAEPPDLWSESRPSQDLRARFADKDVMLFVGSCSQHRGIDVVVRAMALVREKLPNLQMIIVGDGGGIPKWKSLAAELRVDDIVIFEGRKPFREAQKYYAIADFGVIPHQKYAQTDNGIPHKLAQNLINGLPVLVSSCHCLERVVGETNTGLVFRSGYPSSAAQKIVEMMTDATQRVAFAKASRHTGTDGIFGWEQMRSEIIDAYRLLN